MSRRALLSCLSTAPLRALLLVLLLQTPAALGTPPGVVASYQDLAAAVQAGGSYVVNQDIAWPGPAVPALVLNGSTSSKSLTLTGACPCRHILADLPDNALRVFRHRIRQPSVGADTDQRRDCGHRCRSRPFHCR